MRTRFRSSICGMGPARTCSTRLGGVRGVGQRCGRGRSSSDWRPGWPCPVGPVPRIHQRAAATRRTASTATATGAASAPRRLATLLVERRVRDGGAAEARGPGADWRLRRAGDAGRRRRRQRVRPRPAPAGRRGLAPLRTPAPRPDRPGDGGAPPRRSSSRRSPARRLSRVPMLVHRYGERAPPRPRAPAWVQPDAATIRCRRGSGCACTSTPARSRTLVTAARRVADSSSARSVCPAREVDDG